MIMISKLRCLNYREEKKTIMCFRSQKSVIILNVFWYLDGSTYGRVKDGTKHSISVKYNGSYQFQI